MSWQALEKGNKELADFGLNRFGSRVAYLATIRKDGSPRVHPVTPFVVEGHLLVGMDDDSPKGHDLRRDVRYALHCSVEDDDGGEGEFILSGTCSVHGQSSVASPSHRECPVRLLGSTCLIRFGSRAGSVNCLHGRWNQA